MLIKRRRRPMPGRGASSLRGCGRSRDDETRAARPWSRRAVSSLP